MDRRAGFENVAQGADGGGIAAADNTGHYHSVSDMGAIGIVVNPAGL
ncbi:hypothetical protein AB0N05_35355 [Nocardia sp. NPDC051030]